MQAPPGGPPPGKGIALALFQHASARVKRSCDELVGDGVGRARIVETKARMVKWNLIVAGLSGVFPRLVSNEMSVCVLEKQKHRLVGYLGVLFGETRGGMRGVLEFVLLCFA